MRHFFATISAFILLISSTFADELPRLKTQAYYDTIMDRSAALLMIIENIDEPDLSAKIIQNEIITVLSGADKKWTDVASLDETDAYAPYWDCPAASLHLGRFALKVQRYLSGLDEEPFTEVHAQPFKKYMNQCETALGLEPTF